MKQATIKINDHHWTNGQAKAAKLNAVENIASCVSCEKDPEDMDNNWLVFQGKILYWAYWHMY